MPPIRLRAEDELAGEAAGGVLPSPLPMAEAPPRWHGSDFFASASIDVNGRLSATAPLKAAGLEPRRAITVSARPRVGVITVAADGSDVVDRQGFVRIPARVRNACALRPGDRVLMVAKPDRHAVVVYTPSAVATMAEEFEQIRADRT